MEDIVGESAEVGWHSKAKEDPGGSRAAGAGPLSVAGWVPGLAGRWFPGPAWERPGGITSYCWESLGKPPLSCSLSLSPPLDQPVTGG